MKTFKTISIRCLLALLLFNAAISATAQSTWNYFISDAGDGNSLLTWTVSGTLATSPGAALQLTESTVPITIFAPGIFNNSYAGTGPSQLLPTPDGSSFAPGGGDVFFPLVLYSTTNAPGSGNDSFSLSTGSLPPHTGPGLNLLYVPGTQSVVLPIAYSNFNPGTYQSLEPLFTTSLTVNLTVGAVPEPSALTLMVVAVVVLRLSFALSHRAVKFQA